MVIRSIVLPPGDDNSVNINRENKHKAVRNCPDEEGLNLVVFMCILSVILK